MPRFRTRRLAPCLSGKSSVGGEAGQGRFPPRPRRFTGSRPSAAKESVRVNSGSRRINPQAFCLRPGKEEFVPRGCQRPLLRADCSGKQGSHDMAMYICKPTLDSVVVERQLLVVQAQQVQRCGV